MKEQQELVHIKSESVSVQEPSVADMIQAVIQKGVTAESVAVMESLVGLYERMDARKAEKAFTAAFNALQAEIPHVVAHKPVPNKDGTIRYTFAPFEDIMEQLQSPLQKHGFTVSFTTKFDGGSGVVRLIKTCILTHTGGHSRSTEFAVRVGGGPPGASECQADGAASTYAKRFALCDALNIVIDKDTDARAEGRPITPEQAEELERRVALTNSDKAAFLKFAGAATFAEIMSSKYDMLDQTLRRKEQRGR